MQDVFTSQKFLLYSTGVTQILSEHPVALWFNLIAFNGMCWQSYGPIGHYQSFRPDDIRYYASELNPREWFEKDAELLENVERNPDRKNVVQGKSLAVRLDSGGAGFIKKKK